MGWLISCESFWDQKSAIISQFWRLGSGERGATILLSFFGPRPASGQEGVKGPGRRRAKPAPGS